MATREQIGISAGQVNAAFGTWIKFRGAPDVPPIAHQSGVSYTPAQNTLYKEFGDAVKSLPELLKGARNTYETYWEQAKKSADDYRKGKSLAEINAELDAGEVPLQYRPLLMSALEFRQGQESMQIAAQELTTKINSGEYADLSPMDLDQAVTDFMNEQLSGLQEAYGTTGGTDAFYNGYYSEVAKVRQFAQQRNDQLVEQRRQQDIQIQAHAMANELGQTALSAQDVMDGLHAARQTLNLDPASELQFIENSIKAAASNPEGVALLNDLRFMEYRDGTLEDFFTKAYFDSAVINTYNTLRQADAERWSNDIQRWDSLARGGAVGSLKGELSRALQASGNLETQEVQHIRSALLQSQHVAEANAKKQLAEAQLREMSTTVLTGESNFDLSWAFGSEREAVEFMTNQLKPIADSIINAPNSGDAQARTAALMQGLGNLAYTNPSVAAKVGKALYPKLDSLDRMTGADLQLAVERKELWYTDNPEKNQQYLNEFIMLKGVVGNSDVFQSLMGDAKVYGGHEALWFAVKESNDIEDMRVNLTQMKSNYTNTQYSKQHDELSETLFKGDPLKAGMASTYSKMRYTPQQLDNPTVQADIKKFVNDNLGLGGVKSLQSSMAGNPNIDVMGIDNQFIADITSQFKSVGAMHGKTAYSAMGVMGPIESKNIASFAIGVTGVSLLRELGLVGTDEYLFGLDAKEFNNILSKNGLMSKIWQEPVSGKAMMAITDIGGTVANPKARTTINIEDMMSKAANNEDYYWKILQVAKGLTKKEMINRSNLSLPQTSTQQMKDAMLDLYRVFNESGAYVNRNVLKAGGKINEAVLNLLSTDIKFGTNLDTTTLRKR